MKYAKKISGAAVLALSLSATTLLAQQPVNDILNVSYDVSRELFVSINEAFIPYYRELSGQTVTVNQSHGGSSGQARAILEGLRADVVTFNQVTDIDILHTGGNLIPADWHTRLPNDSSPYYSLPAFLVRAGNPKNIQGWADLERDDVQIVFPNPRTSGNARYTYLAATAWATEAFDGDQERIEAYLRKLFSNVPVFDTGGRAATLTFVQREIGDVLITFESEVQGIRREFGLNNFDAVIPSVSLLAEFPVSVVDSVVDARGSRAVAEAYLEFLYTPQGQEILAQHFYRVHHPDVQQRYAEEFPDVRLVTADEAFGGWAQIQQVHFAEGGQLDRVFVNR